MRNKIWVLILIAFFAAAFIAGCGTGDDGAADENGAADGGDLTTHTIVAILPLTGPLGTFGENNAEVTKLAVADVNEWLEEEGRDWRMKLEIDDTQTEGPVGLRKMQSWFGEGVRFFVGPMASGVAQECLSFANSNQILYITPSSTSLALAIDDWLYRFVPSDDIQGPAVAAAAEAAGVEHLIFIWQGDTWGDGLQGFAEVKAIEKGMSIYPEKLRFDPQKEDFTTDAALLDEYVSDLVAQGVPLEKIGINAIVFEQIAPLLAEAAKYDQLWQTAWVGSDGAASSEALKQHPAASEFAIDRKMVNPMAKPTEVPESLNQHVRDHIRELLGRETDSYSFNTYDAVWSLAMCIDQVGYDSAAVKEILPDVADEWSSVYGSSGRVVLNEYGDRAFADYDYFMLNEENEWEIVGYYDMAADEIVWHREIY